MAQLNVNEYQNGTVTQLGSTNISASDGMTLRSLAFGSTLWVFTGNTFVWSEQIPLTDGSPGVSGVDPAPSHGGYISSGFSYIAIGHHDTKRAADPVRTTSSFHHR